MRVLTAVFLLLSSPLSWSSHDVYAVADATQAYATCVSEGASQVSIEESTSSTQLATDAIQRCAALRSAVAELLLPIEQEEYLSQIDKQIEAAARSIAQKFLEQQVQ